MALVSHDKSVCALESKGLGIGHRHEDAFKWNVAAALRIVEHAADGRAGEGTDTGSGRVVDLAAWKRASVAG